MTLDELQNFARDFRGRLEHLHGFLKIEERRSERKAAEDRMAAADFLRGHAVTAGTVL